MSLIVIRTPLKTLILKYAKYSAVLENDFPASQLRREVLRGIHLLKCGLTRFILNSSESSTRLFGDDDVNLAHGTRESGSD